MQEEIVFLRAIYFHAVQVFIPSVVEDKLYKICLAHLAIEQIIRKLILRIALPEVVSEFKKLQVTFGYARYKIL